MVRRAPCIFLFAAAALERGESGPRNAAETAYTSASLNCVWVRRGWRGGGGGEEDAGALSRRAPRRFAYPCSRTELGARRPDLGLLLLLLCGALPVGACGGARRRLLVQFFHDACHQQARHAELPGKRWPCLARRRACGETGAARAAHTVPRWRNQRRRRRRGVRGWGGKKRAC